MMREHDDKALTAKKAKSDRSEFQRFQELTRKLVNTPKKVIDSRRKDDS